MKLKDLEVDFDFYDADNAEAYEVALKAFQESTKQIEKKKATGMAGIIRSQCQLTFRFFDDIFGEGFHKELFGDRVNMSECIDAYQEFLQQINKQTDEVHGKLEGMTQPNRATRRAATRTVGE